MKPTTICLTGRRLGMAGWLLAWSPAIRNTSFVKAGEDMMMFVHCPDPARGPAEEESICSLCRWRIFKDRGPIFLGWPFVACGWEGRN